MHGQGRRPADLTDMDGTGVQVSERVNVILDQTGRLVEDVSRKVETTTSMAEETIAQPLISAASVMAGVSRGWDTYKAEMAKEKESKEIQGVFVVDNNKAKFVAVNTGITGVTDIEVLSGLKSGDKIVTGSYKVLRSLRNGARIKQEKVEVKKDEESS